MRLIDADALIKEMERWDWQELYLPIHFKELLIDEAPTIEPSGINLDESCDDCPLHDGERHSCPRFNKVIPQTIADLKAEPSGDKGGGTDED